MEYAEDLMIFQAENGHDVGYFFAGRHYPWGNPRLKKWHKGRVRHYEIINSPIVHSGDRGTRHPDQDLFDPCSEEFFSSVLMEFRPDLIHIHELAGLPSSLIEIAKCVFDIPLVMTLADYFLLCPTLKLFTISNCLCNKQAPGDVCVLCCAGAPWNRRSLIRQTLFYKLKPLVKKLPSKLLCWIMGIVSITERSGKNDPEICSLSPHAFDERRLLNLKRLKMVDLLIARSRRVEELYRYHLGEVNNLITINPTLRHIGSIQGRAIDVKHGDIIRFVALNGLASVAKGGELLLAAVEELVSRGRGADFELYAFGGLSSAFQKQVNGLPNVHFMGPYAVSQINDLLEGMHVGIVPSVWEEVFGYVGLELLAKGLPLIGNCRGGITEYVIDGETGFVNKSCTSVELADLMELLLDNPDLIRDLNRKILARRWFQSYEDHILKVTLAYAGVCQTWQDNQTSY